MFMPLWGAAQGVNKMYVVYMIVHFRAKTRVRHCRACQTADSAASTKQTELTKKRLF
jgi:hypothetical protein